MRGFPLEVITQDLSDLADACVEAAVRAGAGPGRGALRRADVGARRAAARFVVLGLGKLGGQELNYSSDIDLVFLYDDDGQTDGPKVVSNAEFFARMGSDIVRLLADHTALGIAYRVDMRLRPDGEQGVLARSLDATLGYYVTRGRTWERQALIKCRPVAGDLALGATFLEAIKPFVYRRYLGCRRDRRDQGAQAADRAAHGLGRDRRGRGQDGPGRDSRRRVRRPVPAVAARRRVSGGPPCRPRCRRSPGSSRSAA